MLSDIPTTDVYYTLLYKKFPGLGCFFVVPDVGFFKARMIRDKNSYVKILWRLCIQDQRLEWCLSYMKMTAICVCIPPASGKRNAFCWWSNCVTSELLCIKHLARLEALKTQTWSCISERENINLNQDTKTDLNFLISIPFPYYKHNTYILCFITDLVSSLKPSLKSSH